MGGFEFPTVTGAARHFNDPDFFPTERRDSSPACACAGCYCAHS
jgi:hypothetical protein